MKRLIAATLSAALLLGGIPAGTAAAAEQPNTEVIAADAAFDEGDIQLRLAVMSDVHMSYSSYSAAQIQDVAQRYTNALATYKVLSSDQLDAVMLLGDYTSTGCDVQAEAFAQVTRAALDGIFGDNQPKLLLTYGNHDTSWKNSASGYADIGVNGWEEILDEYNLLDDCEEDSLRSDPEQELNGGCYHVTIEKQGKTYHLLSLETIKYAENSFEPAAVEWLDQQLSAITTESPDSYVYVGTHAPVQEAGTYGTDSQLEGGAGWATAKNNIDNVLKKYPQVVLLTGHTHFAEYLETTIMQKNYTAINVTSVYQRTLYNSQYTQYLDATAYDNGTRGMGLYIEVDGNGSQRIRRVDFADSTVTTTLDVTQRSGIQNPAAVNSGEPATISAITLNSCTVNAGGEPALFGEPWVMPAPDDEKTHLTCYSAARGDIAGPHFAEDDTITVTRPRIGSDGILKGTVEFPAAVSDAGAYILRYDISLFGENGSKIGTWSALGNWNGLTTGVASGTTHFDATAFAYDISTESTYKNFYVEITAVDEYGNAGPALVSDLITADAAVVKPTYTQDKHNYMDTMLGSYGSHDHGAKNGSVTETTFTEYTKYVDAGETGSGYWSGVNYYLSSVKGLGVKEASRCAWNSAYKYLPYMTDIDKDNTVVFEADITTTGAIAYTNTYYLLIDVRHAAEYNNVYNGVNIRPGGVYATVDGVNTLGSGGVKLNVDGVTQHITIVSSPERISVWIDDVQVFDEFEYVSRDADGNARDMLPTLVIRSFGLDTTVSNMKYYLYDELINPEPVMPATNINYMQQAKLRVDGDITEGQASRTVTAIDASGANTRKKFDIFTSPDHYTATTEMAAAKEMSDFKAEDEVVFELDVTPTALSTESSLLKDTWIAFRSNGEYGTGGSAQQYAYLLLRSGYTEWVYCVNGTVTNVTLAVDTSNSFNLLNANQRLHITVKSTNTHFSIWINGDLVCDRISFADYGFTTETLLPCFCISTRNMNCNYSNIMVYKANEAAELPGANALMSIRDNLINSDAFSLYSNMDAKYNNWTYSNGHIYTNLHYSNLKANGYTNMYISNIFSLFGQNNTKSPIGENDSYVYSVAYNKGNLTESDGTNSYTARVGGTLGDDDNGTIWYYQEGNGFYVWSTKDSVNTSQLSAKLAFTTTQVGEAFRLTVIATPTEAQFYLDGYLIYTYVYNGAMRFSPQLRVNGMSAHITDIQIYYNQQYYADALAEAVSQAGQVNAVRYTVPSFDALQQALNEAKAQYEQYGSVLSADTRTYCAPALAALQTSLAALTGITWDIVEDDRADALDVVKLRQMLLGLEEPVDVNGDGTKDILDLIRLKKYIALES